MPTCYNWLTDFNINEINLLADGFLTHPPQAFKIVKKICKQHKKKTSNKSEILSQLAKANLAFMRSKKNLIIYKNVLENLAL